MVKQQQKTKIFSSSDTIAMGTADRKFSESLFDLQADVLEAISSDGVKPHVSSMEVILRLEEQVAGSKKFAIQPVVVQSAGTFTDTVDQNVSTIDEALDAAIDDEFGYQKIGSIRNSKIHPFSGLDQIETKVQIPRNLINLLNKEVSTERLQSLILGIVGHAEITGTIVCTWIGVVNYIETRKGITIR